MKPQLLHQTDRYFVINKPAGMAVEPPSTTITLQDWMRETGRIEPGEWTKEQRFGVVHRLDSDTSGVVIWAKTPLAQTELKTLWQGRAVQKTYLAVVTGESPPSGTIELPLVRDNRADRQSVSWLPSDKSRPALTTYRTLQTTSFGSSQISLVEVHPVTGRTHQIRVHLKAIGHPIIGDELYGEKLSSEVAKSIGLRRQFLHAHKIRFPDGSEYAAPLPAELVDALTQLGFSSLESKT